eukprot:8054188-Lingulodinium_polyedra.AAC.1
MPCKIANSSDGLRGSLPEGLYPSQPFCAPTGSQSAFCTVKVLVKSCTCTCSEHAIHDQSEGTLDMHTMSHASIRAEPSMHPALHHHAGPHCFQCPFVVQTGTTAPQHS